jgi:quinoprotein glucose dehydrogenase
LLGDEVLADWRKRTPTGAARLRAYYDVIPGPDSTLTLDSSLKNEFGDPLPRIQMADSSESRTLREHTENQIRAVFDNLVRAGGGKILSVQVDRFQDHPGGGCRMGTDATKSVVNPFGRSHDHENLWIVGAPTIVSGGCCNGTLTFVALSLRSAGEMAKDLPARRA